MVPTLITILILVAALAWWLSGYDSKLTGHDQAADFKRRFVRCAFTVVIVGIGSAQFLKGGATQAFIGLLVMLPLAVVWIGCASAFSAGSVMHLVDRPDDREFNPKRIGHQLDRLASLVSDGRNHEAIELCRELLESNEASALAIETTLFELYQKMFTDDRLARSTPLAAVLRLCSAQRFSGAVDKLEALLKKEPHNAAAVFLLMRVQAQNLAQPDSARAILQRFISRGRVPPAFDEYARRCIKEWSGAIPRRQKTEEGIESLLVRNRPAIARQANVDDTMATPDELLAAGRLTKAIERLEIQIGAQPQDFGSWLKLAEVHGVYCRDVLRAGKVVDRIASNPAFDAEQVRLAKSKLKEWKTGS